MTATISQFELAITEREAFNAFVYSRLDDAIVELSQRHADAALTQYVQSILPAGLPEAMKVGPTAVYLRPVATPNYEAEYFLATAERVKRRLQPVIFEITNDHFVNRNSSKLSLGKLRLHNGTNRNKEPIFQYETVIDVNASNKKRFGAMQTNWGESLVDFHNRLFRIRFPDWSGKVFDLSSWLHSFGGRAKDYYKPFLGLFLRDGILFENFMIDDSQEGPFIKEVVLPAISEIYIDSGYRPLIVPQLPICRERDPLWLSYPCEMRKHWS